MRVKTARTARELFRPDARSVFAHTAARISRSYAARRVAASWSATGVSASCADEEFPRGSLSAMSGLRLSSHCAVIITFAGVLACGGVTPSPSPSPSPSTSSRPPAGPAPMVQTTWPARTKEHVDLWLHSYAMLTSDTTLIPYFTRGYRDRMVGIRRQRSVSSQLDANRHRFYTDYWKREPRARARAVAHTDSLWQRVWRPALQRFLNNTQQGNGELYLSLPLGGEGRTIHFAKGENVVAGPVPESDAESEHVLYVFAHEVTGSIASAAIADNTTPAEQRSGATSRYEQAAAVRAGALLLERTLPAMVMGYMRYYLQQAGRPSPNDPRGAFTAAFAIPDAVREAIARQLDVVLGGI